MTHKKRLRSVIHSIAHHAVSSMSFLHPHVGMACHNAGIHRIEIDLLNSEIRPKIEYPSKELTLSTTALRQAFGKLLSTEGFESTAIAQAFMLFEFHNDTWPSGCYVQVVTSDAQVLEVAVDALGNKSEILHKRS